MTSISTISEDKIRPKIKACEQVVEDLEIFLKQYLDLPEKMTEDQVTNITLGMIHIYKMRFEDLLREYDKATYTDSGGWID